MNATLRTPGICRIDQAKKHNHGFFVRLQRRGKMYSAFFADKLHGGRESALAAAQKHYQILRVKLGESKTPSRRFWAELPRRKSISGIHGVQKMVDQRSGEPRVYWRATWSPEPYVVRRKQFSVRKHGAKRAKLLAIRARRDGLRSMK
ncbi:MAG: hypothetical protein RLZZ350_1954 [Verrucomicrobiota bacterium]|jgi:hypothetical protein